MMAYLLLFYIIFGKFCAQSCAHSSFRKFYGRRMYMQLFCRALLVSLFFTLLKNNADVNS